MAKNFWKTLKPPILALAPLAGITDSAFRQICKQFGAQVVYSEMASATALYYNPTETLALLKFDRRQERPYVVQLFGACPEHFARAAQIVTEKIKPDGIDINFGCPVKKVMKQGAGAQLMKDPKLSRQVVEAVINNTNLPVSIKVRTQVGNVKLEKFLQALEGLDIKALMIHGRTLKQLFSGPIDLPLIKKIKQNFPGVVLVNGGVNTLADFKNVLAVTGAQGVGIARGALGRPWFFKELVTGKQVSLSAAQIFKIARRHSQLVYRLKGAPGILEMRKHLSWYVSGLSGARKLREQLVQVKTLADIKKILK